MKGKMNLGGAGAASLGQAKIENSCCGKEKLQIVKQRPAAAPAKLAREPIQGSVASSPLNMAGMKK